MIIPNKTMSPLPKGEMPLCSGLSFGANKNVKILPLQVKNIPSKVVGLFLIMKL